MYHGGLAWLRRLSDRRGIALTEFDPAAPETLAQAIRPGTRLVWIEVPTNPTWDVLDIAAAAKSAHAAGAVLAADCTAAPPCTLRALELGADLAFHSGTKYLGGHSDLTAGVLSFARRDDSSARSLAPHPHGRRHQGLRGLAPDPRHPHPLPALRARQRLRPRDRHALRAATPPSSASSTPASPRTPATPSPPAR